MKDIDVRNALKAHTLKKYYNDPKVRIVEEFDISLGEVRADLVVVNGALHGYEIKSKHDTLKRLPNQIIHYSKVFDYVTVVTCQDHVDPIMKMVPGWFGVMCMDEVKGKLKISQAQKGKRNDSLDPSALAMLLWKEELINILTEKGVKRNLNHASKPILRDMVQQNFTLTQLSQRVRHLLKVREYWRFASPSS